MSINTTSPKPKWCAPQSGKGKDPGSSESRPEHGPVRGWQSGAQVAHAAQVLLPGQGVYHRASAQEQQSLKEGMRHQVENAGSIGPHTDGKDHIAQLTHGGVG